MKTSEILREAYERLTPERWFQAGPAILLPKEHPAYCAAIAVSSVVPLLDDLQRDSSSISRACSALLDANELPRERLRDAWGNVVCWNNSPDTTFEDVKLGFKRAIAWAEERGE